MHFYSYFFFAGKKESMSLMSYMDILKTREVQQAFKAKPAKKKERDKNGKDRPEAEPYLESSGSQQDWK
ncbi:hypothetical protein X777_04627 [Ooceraea biroi]|uniref:Uncharacterized protein n=1 Tax=Ooceraea biroi TaxID=2015173 RepID=A0A026X486_OOCBI|nr:hypothetical protein X777_04627 [Ooceraea biroi]